MRQKKPKVIEIADPYFIMFKGPGNENICHIHQRPGQTHEHYGILICDLVRHVANAFEVHEDMVWDWVERERLKPTSPIIDGGFLS